MVLFAGFGGLLILLGIVGLSAISFLSQIRVREESIRQDYVNRDRVLQALRSAIYTSGTHMRDLLLDTDDAAAAIHRSQFLESQNQIHDAVANYSGLVRVEAREPFQQLRQALNEDMTTFAPVLNWTDAQRRAGASTFIRDEVLPRRVHALAMTDRIQVLNEKQLAEKSAAAGVMLSSFQTKLLSLLILTAIIGLGVAGISLWRMLRLESETQLRFAEVVSAREELKRLSAEVVSAQESERRRISRELHDEVGQVLSAIVLGLGNLRSALLENDRPEALRQLELVEDMTQRNVSVVRNISLLLRPTMLDDLGLIPALNWLAREVSRTGPMSVDLIAESFVSDLPVDDLPEEHRTCVFRIVQEALRNASRHSNAQQAHVSVGERDGVLRLSIQDDGKGFDPSQESGLGILGMKERVARLGGELQVKSRPGQGTTVMFELPLPATYRTTHMRGAGDAQEMRPLRTA